MKEEEEDDEECHGELLDSDRTWVSHSLLPRRGEAARDRRDSVSGEYQLQLTEMSGYTQRLQRVSHADAILGLGEKANDSLDLMFDTTAHGEYQSCSDSHLDHSQPGEDDEDDGGEEDNGGLLDSAKLWLLCVWHWMSVIESLF